MSDCGEFYRLKKLLSSDISEEKLAGLVLVSPYLQKYSLSSPELETVLEVGTHPLSLPLHRVEPPTDMIKDEIY